MNSAPFNTKKNLKSVLYTSQQLKLDNLNNINILNNMNNFSSLHNLNRLNNQNPFNNSLNTVNFNNYLTPSHTFSNLLLAAPHNQIKSPTNNSNAINSPNNECISPTSSQNVPNLQPNQNNNANNKSSNNKSSNKKWTAKTASCVAPLSDDYNDWNNTQIRKECTSRNLNLPKGYTKIDRIKALRENDKIIESVSDKVASESFLSKQPMKRSKHCRYHDKRFIF